MSLLERATCSLKAVNRSSAALVLAAAMVDFSFAMSGAIHNSVIRFHRYAGYRYGNISALAKRTVALL
jgi:hypothetical protein